jgi:hypothetical protein
MISQVFAKIANSRQSGVGDHAKVASYMQLLPM